MKDYIDREYAIASLDRLKMRNARNHCVLSADEDAIKKWLEALPDADVVEVRHGRWTREVLGSTSGYGTTVMYQCSACESMAISKYRYCPNCGASMVNEVEQNE